jgi:hypothetical protein
MNPEARVWIIFILFPTWEHRAARKQQQLLVTDFVPI